MAIYIGLASLDTSLLRRGLARTDGRFCCRQITATPADVVVQPGVDMQIALASSFEDYKDHPFSWWEKKNVPLGIGTDNYVTLDTNIIQELIIVLFTDPQGLKITKLLMVATGETRRPYLSHLLWQMRKKYER